MTTFKFTVGKTSTGFDAYYETNGNVVAVTTGDTLAELKDNALEAYNLFAEESGRKTVTLDQIAFEFDLPSFFEFYKEISASGLANRVGMHKSLLSEYINGKRKPSEKQVQKVFAGIKQLGKELNELEFIS